MGDPGIADDRVSAAEAALRRLGDPLRPVGARQVGGNDLTLRIQLASDRLQSIGVAIDEDEAGIAEPRLVRREPAARRALGILDRITALLTAVPARDRRHGDARVLRQALGYCWSVALVGAPADGFDALDRWAASGDADAAWIVRENLKKARLVRADPERAETLRRALY